MSTADVLVAAAAVAEGDPRAADLLRPLCDPALLEGSAEDRIVGLFGRALESRRRGDREGSGNLYDLEAGPTEMLTAFQALIEQTPLVRFGHVASNVAIAALSEGWSSFDLVDVGIGFGTQWPDLLGRLAQRSPAPALRLVGVEVPSPGEDPGAQLRGVAERLGGEAARLGVPFSLVPVLKRAEDVYSLPVGTDPVVISAAFALHHLPDGDTEPDPARTRDAVLGRLLAHRPAALVLAEPDAEHHALPFLPRVAEAMRHYGLVFDVVGELVNGPSRKVIERAFFGREILNVVGGEGAERFERHSRHTAWAARLRRLGCSPAPVDIAALTRAAFPLPAPFSITGEDAGAMLRWKGQGIVAVSAWTPQS